MSVIELFILFLMGCFIGWIIELVYRNIIHKNKINPGFLKGPYLPIYGFSILLLYLISELKIDFSYKLFLFLVFPTTAELITGIIFEKYFKIKLWDYSKEKINFKGIISLKYSIYWTALCLTYYQFLHPILSSHLLNILSNTNYIFFYGMIAGIFLLDVSYAFNVAFRIRSAVNEAKHKFVDFKKFKNAGDILGELKSKIKNKVQNKIFHKD